MEKVSQQYIVERSCAAHCTYQGSNKDWVGVLVHVRSTEADPTAEESPDVKTWMFLSVYGKSGANLQGGDLAPLTTKLEAERTFETKVKEKLKKHHYSEVDVAPFLSSFRVPLVMPDTHDAIAQVATERESRQ